MDPNKTKKLDEILTELADKDAEIKKLQVASKTEIAAMDAEIKKLNEVIITSDKLPKDDKLKLTPGDLANKIKDLELKITNRTKKLETDAEKIRVQLNERAVLDNQIEYINGTRFEYSDNINEKKSNVSVSLYGIIQRDGIIVWNKPIAISKVKKYKKGATGNTSLTYIKEDLKRQLILDNIDLIRSQYNVWIDPKTVTERTTKSQLPKFEISAIIQEETADSKAGNNQNKTSPYELSKAELANINKDFSDNKKKESTSYVNSGISDLKDIIPNPKDQLNPPDSKYENRKNNQFNSTGVQVQPTGNTVITNNNLNITNQENTNINSEQPLTTLLNKVRKATLASKIRSKTNYETQISSNKLTESDKVTVTKEISKLEKEITDGISLYNTKSPNDKIESREQLMAAGTEPAVVSNDIGPAVILNADNNNNNNNKSGSYVETGNTNINPITDSAKDQLNLSGDKSPYLERNSALPEDPTVANLISPTNTSTAEYNNTDTDNSTTQISSDQAYDKMMNLSSMYNQDTKTGDNFNNSSTNIVQSPAISASTGKQILTEPFAAIPNIIKNVGSKTNNLLTEISNKNNINSSGASPYSLGENGAGTTQTINNNMQQQLTSMPQSAAVPQEEKPEPVDNSQLALNSQLLHAIYDVLTTGIKVKYS
jgi:hypothetical protein